MYFYNFPRVKWVLNEDHTLYWNVLGTLLLQNFVLVNSYFYEFFVEQTSVVFCCSLKKIMAKSDLFNDYYINLMPIISKTACATKNSLK